MVLSVAFVSAVSTICPSMCAAVLLWENTWRAMMAGSGPSAGMPCMEAEEEGQPQQEAAKGQAGQQAGAAEDELTRAAEQELEECATGVG